MPTNPEPLTSHGMLSQIRRFSSTGWARFVKIYAPLVYSWVRRAGLQEADGADVTQNVLHRVFKSVDQFERRASGSFRGWLWTITRNEINGWYRAQKRQAAGRGGSNNYLKELPAWADAEAVPGEDDAKTNLIRAAVAVIKGDFQEQTWQAFWRRVVDGEAATDIAADLGMSPTAVRQARFRVLARLRDYVELD